MNNDLPQLPAMDDIQSLLRFESEEGRIWLAEERMVLLRSSEMRGLRRELIDSLGMERAKGLLIRMGYVAGQQDAVTARRLRPDATLFDAFSVEWSVPVDHWRYRLLWPADRPLHRRHGQYRAKVILAALSC